MNSVQAEALPVTGSVSPPITQKHSPPAASDAAFSLAPAWYPQLSKAEVRTSLKASTLDGIFAAVFSNVTAGVLLSNFLVGLNASPMQIGLLASVPMVANLLQPLGAYFSERARSRHQYCLWIYGVSRLLWLILVLGIMLVAWGRVEAQHLVAWTLGIGLLSYLLGALGSASWMSWMATLVPQRLRGRYFGLRNSTASLTTLVAVPIAGVLVSAWPSGPIQGYGVLLTIGILAGVLSLGFQFWISDVNPQMQRLLPDRTSFRTEANQSSTLAADLPEGDRPAPGQIGILQDSNFLVFLLYFGLWMFAVHLSAPFFNLYMLDTLKLDVKWVTLYSSLASGAHIVMTLLWGKLADRVGNRSILLAIGTLVAVTPLLWLGTDAGWLSLWLGLPLLHLLHGGTWAAIDLCSHNIQLEIAPVRRQSIYFAVIAAVTGVSGALGTTVGGALAEFANCGGLLGLFALSSVCRLAALLPLVFVQERGRSLRQMVQAWFAANPMQSTGS